MTSFVNLMANDDWSEADTLRRTESMIASEYPPDMMRFINRVLSAMSLGAYTPSADEMAQIERYQAVCFAAREAGIAARADMALLREVWAVEAALRRLAIDPADPATDEDIQGRAAAQALVDGASEPVLALVALRNPPTDPIPIDREEP